MINIENWKKLRARIADENTYIDLASSTFCLIGHARSLSAEGGPHLFEDINKTASFLGITPGEVKDLYYLHWGGGFEEEALSADLPAEREVTLRFIDHVISGGEICAPSTEGE
jgi:hypothetical protein